MSRDMERKHLCLLFLQQGENNKKKLSRDSNWNLVLKFVFYISELSALCVCTKNKSELEEGSSNFARQLLLLFNSI